MAEHCMLSVVYATVTYAECHIKTPYAECHYAGCHYAKCLDTKRSATFDIVIFFLLKKQGTLMRKSS